MDRWVWNGDDWVWGMPAGPEETSWMEAALANTATAMDAPYESHPESFSAPSSFELQQSVGALVGVDGGGMGNGAEFDAYVEQLHAGPSRPSSSASNFSMSSGGWSSMNKIPSASASVFSDGYGLDTLPSSHESDLPRSEALEEGTLDDGISLDTSVIDDDGTELTDAEVAAALGVPLGSAAADAALPNATWAPSTTIWLESDVSSRVAIFPASAPYYYTTKSKVQRVEKVTGLPSQIPIPEVPTLFILDAREIAGLDEKKTMDALFKDREIHSFDGSTGSRSKPDAKLPGPLFGLPATVKVPCRRIEANCLGVNACESLDPAFLKMQRRSPDCDQRTTVVEAEIRMRELQDMSAVGRALAFLSALERWECRATLLDGTRCLGKAEMVKTTAIVRGKNHILLCSRRAAATCSGSPNHSAIRILDHIDEDLLRKAMAGEKIAQDDAAHRLCAHVRSHRSGSKVDAPCPFPHLRDGHPFPAKIRRILCEAKYILFAPWESVVPEVARMLIVVPNPKHPHTHPPPPITKLTSAIRDLYKECVRRVGIHATVKTVEKAASTIAILGTTPVLYHPSLASNETRTRLVNDVKAELLETTGTNVNQQLSAYIDEQRILSLEKKFVQSYFELDGKRIIIGINYDLIQYIHRGRTLDCDTSFKPVALQGMTIYEINMWLAGINRMVTVGRVWMEVHTRHAFRHTWLELQRIVLSLTKRRLAFKTIHKGGTLLGMNADMEAAPLLGFADAFMGTADMPGVAERISSPSDLLSYILRVCHTHADRGIPNLDHLSKFDADKIRNFKFLASPDAVEEFKIWIKTVDDPSGGIATWWKQKLMHVWLLPAIIKCLSSVPSETWDVMPASTNPGEAQHAWNNRETGVGMGVIESFKKYEDLDIRTAAEIKQAYETAALLNPRNELTHRMYSSTRRNVANADKAKRAAAADDSVRALELEQARHKEAGAELKKKLQQAKAEAKSNSSGRTRGPRKRAAVPPPSSPKLPEPVDIPPTTEIESNGSAEAHPAAAARPKKRTAAAAVLDDPQGGERRVSRRQEKARVAEAAPAVVDVLSTWTHEERDGGRVYRRTGRQLATSDPVKFAKLYPNEVKHI